MIDEKPFSTTNKNSSVTEFAEVGYSDFRRVGDALDLLAGGAGDRSGAARGLIRQRRAAERRGQIDSEIYWSTRFRGMFVLLWAYRLGLDALSLLIHRQSIVTHKWLEFRVSTAPVNGQRITNSTPTVSVDYDAEFAEI